MPGTVREYFVNAVVQAHEGFVHGYANRELGRGVDLQNAATLAEALLNLPDYVMRCPSLEIGFPSARGYRESLWPSFAYELVCDYANTWKHSRITRDGRRLNARGDIQQCLGIVKYVDETGPYFATRKLLAANCTNGRCYDLGKALVEATEVWIGELLRLEVIPARPELSAPIPAYQDRQAVESTPPITLLGVAGEDFEVHQRRLVYVADKDEIADAPPGEEFDVRISVKFDIDTSPFQTGRD